MHSTADKSTTFQLQLQVLLQTKAMISGLRCVNEGHEFLKKT